MGSRMLMIYFHFSCMVLVCIWLEKVLGREKESQEQLLYHGGDVESKQLKQGIGPLICFLRA